MATEVSLCGLGLLLLGVDLILPRDQKRWVGVLGIAGLLATVLVGCVVAIFSLGQVDVEPILGGTYLADGFTNFFRLFALGVGLVVMFAGLDYLDRVKTNQGEFFALIVFATLALILLAGAADLITVYLFIEFVSLTSYVLAGYLRGDKRSAEASIKYLLYGAITAAIMLYGMSLLYGVTGSTNLQVIAENFGKAPQTLQLLAVSLILVGLGFKIAMVPFHQWAPDVYEGAPTPITLFMSIGPKAAGFAVLLRVLLVALPDYQPQWAILLAVLSAVTMTLGNLLALWQSNIKRMLAYSSIAHAGYLLIGVVAVGEDFQGVFGLLVYLVAYLLMNAGAFAIAIWLERNTGSNEIEEFAGLSQTAPLFAGVMAIFLLSLTGIPPTAGFLGKWWLFAAAINSPYWWLAVVGIVNSVISLFYYWNVVRVMYLLPPKREEPLGYSVYLSVVILGAVILTVALVLWPNLLLEIAQGSKHVAPHLAPSLLAAR